MNDLGIVAGVAVVISLILYIPRKLSRRTRTIAGVVLFIAGWAGALIGLILGDEPWLHNETVAFTWMGISAAAILLGIVMFPSVFEWWRAYRPRRQRREKWPNS